MGHFSIASVENIWLAWMGLCLPRSIAIWYVVTLGVVWWLPSVLFQWDIGNVWRLEMGDFALYSCRFSICLYMVLTFGSYDLGHRSTAWVERQGRRQGKVKQRNLGSCISHEYPSMQERGWMLCALWQGSSQTECKVRTVSSGKSHPQIALCVCMPHGNSMQTS